MRLNFYFFGCCNETCTISPASINYYQTLSTLRFATRAKIVKNKPTINEVVEENEALAMQYQQEIDKLKDEIAVKDSQLIKFQEYHEQLQINLNQEKEIKERLISEIKTTYRESEQESEYDALRQKLEQEQYEKNQLITELEQARSSRIGTERKSCAGACDSNPTLVESLASNVEQFVQQTITESSQDNRLQQHLKNIPQEKLELRSNQIWAAEIQRLQIQYQQDLLQLQNEYRKQVQGVVATIFEGTNQSENFLSDAIIQGVLQLLTPSVEQQQYANAKRVLNDIESGRVFDDIVVEYEDILENGFKSLGYSIDQLINNMVLPSFEDAENVAENLKQYYMQLIRVSQKRYDEVKQILETFFRQMIAEKRDELDLKHKNDELTEDDFEMEQSTFTSIADQHHEKLSKLRENFDLFNQHIDVKFDDIMKKLRQWSGYGEEDQLNFQDSSSSKTSDKEGSIISINRSETRSNRIPEAADREGNMRLEYNPAGSKKVHQYLQKMSSAASMSTSIHEDPGEVRPLIFQNHDIVSPTPKFSHASKFVAAENRNDHKENQQHHSSSQRNLASKGGALIEQKSNLNMIMKTTQSLHPRVTCQSLVPQKGGVSQQIHNNTGSKVFMWGSGKDGRLGNGKETNEKVPTSVNSQHRFVSVSSGYYHSAGVSKDGLVLTWGRGIFGQLGHGDTQNYSLPTPVESLIRTQISQVACGCQHTLCLTTQGKIFSWGYAEEGQLGHGDTYDQTVPKEIEFFKKHGIKVGFIAAGHSHSGCITESSPARLFMWGSNPDCRLMTDDNSNKYFPTLTLLERLREAQAKNDPTDSNGEGYEPFAISLGVTHSAVITRNGELYTGGSKLDGQLGLNFQIKYPQEQQKEGREMKEISLPLHMVEGFGMRYDNKAVSVACGESFSVVLTERNELYSFGKATHGRLGLGPAYSDSNRSQSQPDYISIPTHIEALAQEKVLQISAGYRHAGCVTESGKLYSWGFNFYEQLGMGDSERDFDLPTRVQKNLFQQRVNYVSCGYFHTGALVE